MSINYFTANAGKLTAIFFTILQLSGFLLNSAIPALAGIFSLLVIPIRFSYFYRLSDISKNMARYILWFSWDLSLIVLPMFMFDTYASNVFTAMSGQAFLYTPEDISFCIYIGVVTLFLTYFSSVWWVNKETPKFDYFPCTSKTGTWMLVVALLLVHIISLLLVKILGLGSFGESGRLLPFKLTAIINFFASGIDLFVQFCVMDALCKRKVNIIIPIAIILGLGFLGSIVYLSKGKLIMPVAVILVYLIMTKKLSFSLLCTNIALLVCALIIASFVASYRSAKISSAYVGSLFSYGMGYSALSYLHRACSDGLVFMKLHATTTRDELDDLLKYYDYKVAEVMTYGIDKTPVTSMHSSGCATLPGAYMFGYSFLILTVVGISLVLTYVDYGLPRTNGIFASTIMRTFLAFYAGKIFFTCIALEYLTKLINGTYNNALFTILLLLCFVVYLKMFCRKTDLSPT